MTCANRCLIAHAGGLPVIPEKVPDFKRLLVAYYEDWDQGDKAVRAKVLTALFSYMYKSSAV